MNSWNPDNVFGVSIFVFFVLSVLTFMYVSYRFMTQTGGDVKKGERIIMWGSAIGVVFVVIYAVLALVFKIII